MSVAEPFTALGRGNGFPFCLFGSEPTTYPKIHGTLSEIMNLYWNLKSIRVFCDISVTVNMVSNGGNDPPETPSVFTISLSMDTTYGAHLSGTPVADIDYQPKVRTCSSSTTIGTVTSGLSDNEEYASGGISVQLQPRLSIRPQVAAGLGAFGGWGEDPSGYYYQLPTGHSITCRVQHPSATNFGNVAGYVHFLNANNTNLTDFAQKEVKSFTIPGYGTHDAIFHWNTRGLSYSGQSANEYVSHTWNSVGIEFEFWEYS